MNDKVRVFVRTAQPLCEHCPSSDGSRAWIWYFISNAEGRQEIKIVCQKCGAELYVRNQEIHLDFKLVQRLPKNEAVTGEQSAPPPPPAPQPERHYDGIPYAHQFTKMDEALLRRMKISAEGITIGKRIDE